MPPITRTKLVLVTGGTGYVGGRLLAELVDAGYRVRCLARRPEHLRQRVPIGVEVIAGDVLDAKSLGAALAGVAVAYYLVHSMAADACERGGLGCAAAGDPVSGGERGES